MAAIRVLELSIFVLFIAAATTTADYPYGKCLIGQGGDLAVAGQIKESLIKDLTAKLPERKGTYYCNVLEQDGLKMFGFGECPGRDSNGADSMKACTLCLDLVGKFLIANCGDTGAGYAWDSNSACYFKVGYSLDVCPKATY